MKLVNDGQPLAKRRHRASSTSSSVRPVEVRTPPVIELLRDVGPCAGLNLEEEILDDHEWQAQCIIGSDKRRRDWNTKSALRRRCGCPVRRLTQIARGVAGRRAATRFRMRWLPRLQRASSPVGQR